MVDFLTELANALGAKQRKRGAEIPYANPNDYGAIGRALEQKDQLIASRIGSFSGNHESGDYRNQTENYWDMMQNGGGNGGGMTFKGKNTATEEENPLAGWLQAIQGTQGGTNPLMAMMSLLQQGWGKNQPDWAMPQNPKSFSDVPWGGKGLPKYVVEEDDGTRTPMYDTQPSGWYYETNPPIIKRSEIGKKRL